MNLDRLELLVGCENLSKIKSVRILLIGVGGVGGYVLESLIRCGVTNITIIDGDIIDETNLNRQIITTSKNVGKSKVSQAMKRALEINPCIKLKTYNMFLKSEEVNDIISKSYDYVIDACDTIHVKASIINTCYKEHIKLISCMGTANKLDASKLKISTLDKTSYCPLAKKLRGLLSSDVSKNTTVIYSTEEVKKRGGLGTISYLPGVAGLLITNYIICDILKEKN